jgi:D-3-phosphoglycerate dehydrogenase
MKKLRVLIESRPFCVFDNAPMEKLQASEVLEITDMRGSGVDNADFVAALKTSDAVLCGNDLVVDEALFAMAPGLKVIAKQGAGLDTVDIEAATRHGALVFHTPGVNNQAVADHTFAMILALARKIIYCDTSLREKRWEHTKILGLEIWQKTLGLVGLGAIGRCVAQRAAGFQMKVVAYDPFWPEAFAAEHHIEQVQIEELLRVSDIVSLHAPLTPENRGMINARTLALMKPNALLINAARGGLVKEDDLCQALENGVIAGAGLDVFEKEPPSDSPLLARDNVVLTPHTAAFTHEAMNLMNVVIVDELLEYAAGRKPAHCVNSEVWDQHHH